MLGVPLSEAKEGMAMKQVGKLHCIDYVGLAKPYSVVTMSKPAGPLCLQRPPTIKWHIQCMDNVTARGPAGDSPTMFGQPKLWGIPGGQWNNQHLGWNDWSGLVRVGGSAATSPSYNPSGRQIRRPRSRVSDQRTINCFCA